MYLKTKSAHTIVPAVIAVALTIAAVLADTVLSGTTQSIALALCFAGMGGSVMYSLFHQRHAEEETELPANAAPATSSWTLKAEKLIAKQQIEELTVPVWSSAKQQTH